MNARDLTRAALIPILEPAVLMVLVLFTVVLFIGMTGGPLGILVLIFSLPPIFRYLMQIVEDCARGVSPGALDAEFFNWVGGGYAFFPMLLTIGFCVTGFYAYDAFGMSGVYVTEAIAILVFPASLALLAITHSPLQSISPVAIWRLLAKLRHAFWIAPLYLALIVWFSMQSTSLPLFATNFVQLFMIFSFSAVVGTLIAPERLIDDVDIPVSTAPLRDKEENEIEKIRVLTLSHAYGFIGRDNRKGGFEHLFTEIENDPDPKAAWAWYFQRMLDWENQQHALFFAQHYVHDALQHGEDIVALKTIMHCCLIDRRFRPFADDIPAAVEAAEKSRNTELMAVLNRS
jgi:hypothetical protein